MEIIKTVNLTKMYGDFTANDKINISVNAGEIKAIVGENGAGKTTLMNMLYGLLKPTNGEIYIKGNHIKFDSPTDAMANGIGMVHQHFKLVPSLTVYENVLLGTEILKTRKFGKKSFSLRLIDKQAEIKAVNELIEKYNFNISAESRIKDISVGARQKVEILKMLYRNVEMLIFDEPTAVLTPQEILTFFETLRTLKEQGKTIILITHKLQEVMEVSDSVTVIKQGKVIGNLLTKETSSKELARLMVGRDVLLTVDKQYRDYKNQDIVYRLEGLTTRNNDGINVVNNVSFSIRKGEIVGIAGVEGNGQSELLDMLTGVLKSTSGKVFLNEKEITNFWPRRLRESKVAFIPEDRYEKGLCSDMLICENMIAGYHGNKEICKYGLISPKKMLDKLDKLIDEYDIRVSDKNGLISSLSGGNAQKIIIAREFDSNPELLIAAQPTRGVDIGAIEYIHHSILDLQKEDKSILLISSELSEIMNLSDRILVMFKGEIIGEVDARTATREEIGLLMAGIRKESKDE